MAEALKAYVVEDKDYYKPFATVVFAKDRNEARLLGMRTDACEDLEYLEIRATRRKELDGSYRGRWEMDWNDPQDRVDLVRLGNFSCSDEMDWEGLCPDCPAKEWCDKYEEYIDEMRGCEDG